MSTTRPRGPIVIDTDVFSADLVPGSKLAELYAPVITGRPAFISFQTVTELRYGALRRGWGTTRMLKLDAKIQRAEVVHTGPELVLICAQLRADCAAVGHALAQREHNADRWIAATAIRLGVPLVSNDVLVASPFVLPVLAAVSLFPAAAKLRWRRPTVMTALLTTVGSAAVIEFLIFILEFGAHHCGQ